MPLNIFTPYKKLVQTGFPSFLLCTEPSPRLVSSSKYIYARLMANWKPNLQNYGKFYASGHKHLKEMPPHCRELFIEPINNATGRQVITAPTLTHTNSSLSTLGAQRPTPDALRSPVTFINRHPLYCCGRFYWVRLRQRDAFKSISVWMWFSSKKSFD